jgi:hypothetical protein
MKRTLYTLASLLAIALMFNFSSCGSSKHATVADRTGAIEISLPFQGPAYRNSATHFRAVNNGKSPDLATAKKIAMVNARNELAANIESTIKAVTENYTQQRRIDDITEFSNKFEELTRQVVSQQLNQVNVMDEKMFQETDGSYTSWVAIEMPVNPIIDEVGKNISRDQSLRQDYDKMLFEKVFNEEMDKLEKERP